MHHSLEEEYRDFIQIQGLKGQIDVPRVAEELGLSEEDLFEFVNQRVVNLQERGFNVQSAGEYLGTSFLFGYWLRGVRGEAAP